MYEREYLQAKQELLVALNELEDTLAPETIAIVKESLLAMEQAAQSIRLALNEDPNNPSLERMLLATYRSEVSLLKQAVQLAYES